MSLTTAVILNVVLVVALCGVLAYVLRIPFRLGGSPVLEPVRIERAESEKRAA
jgi:hypothetical protein